MKEKKAKSKIDFMLKLPETRWFWVVMLLALAGMAIGIFLLPVWENFNVFWKDWSEDAVSFILFAFILLYIVIFLYGRYMQTMSKTVKGILLAEIIVMAIIAFCCLLQQLGVSEFFGPCFVVGAILWLRGLVNIVKAYKWRETRKKEYPLWYVIMSVAIITAGTVLMTKPIKGDAFIWGVSVLIIAASACVFVCSFFMIPKKKDKTL